MPYVLPLTPSLTAVLGPTGQNLPDTAAQFNVISEEVDRVLPETTNSSVFAIEAARRPGKEQKPR